MIPDIAVVVIGYNRPAALKRLLDSLTVATYDRKVKLYISIDGEREKGRRGEGENVILSEAKELREGGSKGEEEKRRRGEGENVILSEAKELRAGGSKGKEVRKMAAEYEWAFGEKKLIFHETNLGLRDHVLSCGDLSGDHDGIIVLEDDLLVSPVFYEFATKAFEYYSQDAKISGISLYHHAYNETAQFPFMPISDGSDVYFLKYASSWGQVWGKEQWKGFREWYDTKPPDKSGGKSSSLESLPANIKMWPANSWKKFFIEYLIEKDLYFVYPRVSLTTIFGDSGTNIRIPETFLQVPLSYGMPNYKFQPFIDSHAVYDTWCEMLPDRMKRLCPSLQDEDFDVDLYGMKFSGNIATDKVLSGRVCRSPLKMFGREMKPHEENIIRQLPGEYFHFGERQDFDDIPYLARVFKCHEKKELAYWYPIREYHFYKEKLLATGRNPYSPSNSGFLFRKAMATAGYLLRYFLK